MLWIFFGDLHLYIMSIPIVTSGYRGHLGSAVLTVLCATIMIVMIKHPTKVG